MAKTQNQWKWYLVVSEYLELKNGIDVVADYQTSSAIYSDTKLDHEKEYLYIYRFSHPTTGERIEHSFPPNGKCFWTWEIGCGKTFRKLLCGWYIFPILDKFGGRLRII